MKGLLLILLLCVPLVYAVPCDTAPEFPAEVSVAVFLVDVVDVDDVEQTFTADVGVELVWSDPGIAANCDQIWTPEMLILNARDVEQTYETFSVKNGKIAHLQRFYGDFSADMNLQEFPLDDAVLSIVVMTPKYTKDEITFVPDERAGGLGGYAIGAWNVSNERDSVSVLSTNDGLGRSLYTFEADAHRYTNFYYWKLFLPVLLIVLVSWAVFWFKPVELGPQVSVGLISMLNIIAYNFAVSAFLPRVSFLTRADEFMIGCITLVFLALMEGVVTGTLASKKKVRLAGKIDRASRIIAPILLALILLKTFL